MFPWYVVLIAFLFAFLGVSAPDALKKRGHVKAQAVFAAFGLVASVYCFTYGIYLFSDWHDPLENANPVEVGHAAATHGGRGGIVLLIIRFWPYVLIALDGLLSLLYFLILRDFFVVRRIRQIYKRKV